SNDAQPSQGEQNYRVDFSELQRLHLRQLQYKLVQHAVAVRYDTESIGWTEHLRNYVQAVQDFTYMQQQSQQSPNPFHITIDTPNNRRILREAMSGVEDATEPLRWRPSLPDSSVETEDRRPLMWKIFLPRALVAALGTIFLFAPMWLIVLHKTRYTALITTTVFVVVFGLTMTWIQKNLREAISSTSAYAALMIVFVGLST
ncbi:hypothetical protein L207DRAFT_408167, partial [Hyaloscypha variabilis F]